MKRFTISLFLTLLFASVSFGQVFNTSSTLKPGNFSLGIKPVVYVSGGPDFDLYFHGGIGIVPKIDFGLKLGVLGGGVYFGGDLEFNINKYLSLAGGVHVWGDLALDFTGLLTLPLGPADIYSGLDLDVVLADGGPYFPLWLPIGVELPIRKNILFFFETEILLTNYGSHMIGGGVSFIF